MPGLISVGFFLHVQHPDTLQLCRFKPSQTLKPPPEALSVCDSSQKECDDLTYCVNQDLNDDFFSVCGVGEEFGEEGGDVPKALSVDTYLDGLVSSYFDGDDDNSPVDLGAVFLALDERESQFSEL